jgi:hypothetical protein
MYRSHQKCSGIMPSILKYTRDGTPNIQKEQDLDNIHKYFDCHEPYGLRRIEVQRKLMEQIKGFTSQIKSTYLADLE